MIRLVVVLYEILCVLTILSIGGVIGTGLFLGTAGSLQNGGPVGLLLGYAIVGTITYCVMISLGEMIAYLPIPGGHIALAERFVDPAFAFTMVSRNVLTYLMSQKLNRVTFSFRVGTTGTTGAWSCPVPTFA